MTKRNNFIPIFIAINMFWLTIFSLLVIADTIVTTPPLNAAESTMTMQIKGEAVVLSYSRELTVLREFIGHVDRHIVHGPSGHQIILPESSNAYNVGTHKVTRIFYLPKDLPKGEWCLHAMLEWHPKFSLSEHRYQAPKVCTTL